MAMTYTEICLLAINAKKVETGFIQAYIGKQLVRAHKAGGEDHEYGDKIVKHYRVVMCDGKATAERTSPDLMTAIREVFTELQLELPEQLRAMPT